MNNLSLLLKPASFRCNLECEYCFYKRVEDVYDEPAAFMDYETLDATIKAVMTSGASQVSFCWQGGEPTLMGVDFFKKAVELQQKYSRMGQTVENSLQTNGVLLDEEWFRFLREYRFLVGISLDGPREYHDTYRKTRGGEGTYQKVMDTIEGMNDNGVDYNILTLLNDVNVRHPDNVYHFMRENNFQYLQFIPCFEVDESTGKLMPFSVGGKELGEFYCKLFDLWYDDGFPYVSIRLFEDILIYLVDGALVSCCWMNECKSYIVVEHNGDCYPCDFFVYPQWHIGNITGDPLTSILNNSKRQLFSNMKSEVPNSCYECEWYDFCHADCTRFRLDRNGTFTNTSEYCQAWFMLLEHIKPRKDELKKRAVNLRESVLSGNFDQVGRNDDCPCGSGKKLKKCCGRGTLVI